VKFATLLALSFLAPLQADIVGIVPLRDAVEQADIIVVGELTGGMLLPDQRNGNLTIQPLESLKGDLPNKPMVVWFYSMERPSLGYPPGQKVIVMAKRGSGSMFDLVPLQLGGATELSRSIYPVSPAAVPEVLRVRRRDTAFEKVLKRYLLIYQTAPSLGDVPPIFDFRNEDPKPDLLRAFFREMIHTSWPEAFERAAYGLVHLGEAESLETLDRASPAQRARAINALNQLEYAYRDTSRKGIGILSRWLDPSRPPKERQAAAGALAQLHTPQAVVILASKLEDPDFEVRWRVIRGLSYFAHNIPIGKFAPAPGPWPFNPTQPRFSVPIADIYSSRAIGLKDEAGHLDFWKSWWRQHELAIRRLAN
jgi:hypothetical protein